MQETEKPRAWGNRQRGGNGESDLINPTKNAPKNQSFESSRIRSAIDICADVSSLTLLAYLLAHVMAWGWGVTP